MKGHICSLPMYWGVLVATGTSFTCADCGRVWWMDRSERWASEEEEDY